MSVKNLADVARIGLDVLTTSLSSITGLVSAQLGNVVTNVATSADAEWYFPPGVVARPRKPDAGSKAAQVVTITRSDHDAIVGCRDPRVASIYGALQDGETAVFASVAGGGVAVFKADGSISVTNGGGTASVTINANGTANVYGSTVNVGDAAAQSLTYAVKFQALCDALATVVATNCANGVPLAGNTTFQTQVATIKAGSGTTKAMGT